MARSIYLDYQSSKPVDPRVIEAMRPWFYENFGNPSALHYIGDQATTMLEKSRSQVADSIHAKADEIVFTSGATEANNLAIIGYAMRNKNRGNHIIISEIEHISIINITKFLEKNGFKISRVPVDHFGMVNIDKIRERITDQTILVSIAYASNEVGTIQPITEIGKLCREKKIVLHSDAVAAVGLLPINVISDNVDLLSLSSNDIYGPKGTGALFIKEGLRLIPVIIGGGQENGLRSGTENLPGIAGMAKAAVIMQTEMENEVPKLIKFREKLINKIPRLIPKTYLNGHPTERLPNNAHFRFDGIEGEALLLSLKDKNIAVSTGSACSSKTLEPSHTLIAMGLLHEEAHGSLQLTCGRFTVEQDIDTLIDRLPAVVDRLRKLSPLYREA
ncbi:cysteine desulfurase NifS [candidate division WOR-3 bacterium RBG_13_43_14]|uniref:Cysteine desulfurase NifS n=1 Tax=candidate division WOR-3 bacterium RBG_13_43_14 TaxID=1802590 RepID=A0A1F4UCU8_UNCW3|nr:MAG: cysteine desulfurase NifS [candidate division WOR-3 bacterium RBG_13_43_14]